MLLKQLKKNPLFQFLASLKLAVILLVALAGILATATFYESLYDTKTANYLVYKSPFFACFLTFLGVNLTASALMRYPWKKSQTGFVLTHLGIIIILFGSLVTMYSGVDGSAALNEGDTTKRVMIDEPVLYFGRDLSTLVEIPAEYRWNPPKPDGREYRYTIPGEEKMEAVIDDYYHHASSETLYTQSQEGAPALEVRLFNPNVDQKVWLTPVLGEKNLGPATLSFSRLPSEEAVKRFISGENPKSRGTLQILIEDEPQVINLDHLKVGEPYRLEREGASLELVRYLPHAAVEENELVSKSDDPLNPAVEIKLKSGASSQSWLLFAVLPELNTRIASEGEEFQSSIIYNRQENSGQRSLEFGLTPSGELLYRVDRKEAKPIKEGDIVKTDWMNLQAELVTFLPKARQEKLVREVKPKKGKEDTAPGPAIRMVIDGVNRGAPMWLERGDIRKLNDDKGQPLYVGYGYKTVALPFEIKLVDFRTGFNPGTQTAATYESDVEVNGEPFTIAMNTPYEGKGYKVFQASFSKSSDGRDVSVFAIAKDPGIGLKYFGSIMLVVGIIIMFYFKPKKAARTETAESGLD